MENIQVQDKVQRAAGILQSAQMLSLKEFMELISYFRFGLGAGLLKGISFEELNVLALDVQPANLMVCEKRHMSETERDILRAAKTRELCRKVKE